MKRFPNGIPDSYFGTNDTDEEYNDSYSDCYDFGNDTD
jgi:hypothetical protein